MLLNRPLYLLVISVLLVGSFSLTLEAAESTGQGITLEDCVIEPNKVASVSSAVTGVIDKLAVKRGQLVKKGQVLATLNARVEKATVELARVRSERDQAIKAKRARLDFTKRRLKRNQSLFEQNLISEQIVDEAETDVLLAELELGEFLEERMIALLELERARQALEVRTIRSPFAGVVIDVLAAAGESIENRPLLRIASIDPLNVEVIAPVQLFGKIKKGMKAKVIPEEPIGGNYTARVVIVDRVLDAASGTFGIRLQLPNRKYKLPAGLRCQVDFPA
jgi:RND family efflux transporter MFP subunit